MTTMTIRRLVRAWPAALLLLGFAGGCSKPFRPAISPPSVASAPTPDSPQDAIRLFEWCWNERDIATYGRVFTDDFRFIFALGDSAGNPFRDDPVTREVELAMARHLFVGGGSGWPVISIVLVLDPTLRVSPDSRPGKNAKWHKEILTSVDLAVTTEDSTEYRILGNARFFVVRGDSALIPQELGLAADSTRWYIDRWDDETLQRIGGTAHGPADPGDLRADRALGRLTASTAGRSSRRPVAPAALVVPPLQLTWGQLKAWYW